MHMRMRTSTQTSMHLQLIHCVPATQCAPNYHHTTHLTSVITPLCMRGCIMVHIRVDMAHVSCHQSMTHSSVSHSALSMLPAPVAAPVPVLPAVPGRPCCPGIGRACICSHPFLGPVLVAGATTLGRGWGCTAGDAVAMFVCEAALPVAAAAMAPRDSTRGWRPWRSHDNTDTGDDGSDVSGDVATRSISA